MRPWLRRSLIGLAVVVAILAVAATVWVLRIPDPEAGPLTAATEDPAIVVTVEDDGDVAVRPAATVDGAPTIVFYPGAGVPPAAYVATWAPVVEETGAVVVIPPMPLALAVLDADAAARVRTETGDSGGPWWVGGHSLGGAMAASFVADQAPGTWDGLVLWAAYPPGAGLPDRDDLSVVSVSGSRDGLTTPDEVEASRTTLPADTVFVELDGVNHAQFGAYGDQVGDGTATVTDEEARAAIAAATAEGIAAAG